MTGESSGTPPFDPETLAFVAARAKKQIRARMRSLRASIPRAALEERSGRIVERLLNLEPYARATAIASYAPMEGRGEVDVSGLFAPARAAGKRLYYPFLDREGAAARVGFRQVEELTELEERGAGFPEPAPNAREASAADLELVIVPALAMDAAGRRLGQGSGFYDTVLPRHRPRALAVAVVFDFQLVGELPVLPHDVSCDLVVTDARVLDLRGG